MSIKRLLEDVMRVLYDDGMSVTRIMLPQALKTRLDQEVGELELTSTEQDEIATYKYKGDFKEVEVIVGNAFAMEVE